MKHNKCIFSLLALFICFWSYAGPVHKKDILLEQPDGSVVRAVFRGDEFMRIKTDIHGHAIMQDKDGWWCYAFYDPDGRKVCSSYHVGDDAPSRVKSESRSIPYMRLAELSGSRRAMVAEERPLMQRIAEKEGLLVKGDASDGTMVKHGIVILAQFANLGFKHTREDFEDLLNKKGYSIDGATGCAKEYFEDQFDGKVEFVFDVSEIVTLSQDLAYYGGNTTDSNGLENDNAPAEMVVEACKLADGMIDFSLYDDDGDGQVDNVFIFFAGGDEADGAGDDCIWSHAWYIRDGAGMELVLDGKIINRYACTSELKRTVDAAGDIRTSIAGIGAFCHEYSHTFGLPDMYDTDYEGSGGLSDALWRTTSLMDGGNYNNDGCTPPYFNSIEREILGMSKPEKIVKDGVYSLKPLQDGGRYYRIDTDEEQEYYLLECRSEEGWDSYIGGSGLLVYHIDKTKRDVGYSDSYGKNLSADQRWTLYNEVNCRPDHQCADLVEAVPEAANVRNVFFPAAGVSTIEPDRLPFWSGTNNEVTITGITMNEGVVTFNVVGMSGEAPPEPIGMAFEAFQDAAIVTFESDRLYEGEATVTWGRTGKDIVTQTLLPYEPGKYALVLDGLQARTSYTVTISFVWSGVSGKEGVVSFMTNSDNGGYPYIYLKNVKRNPDGTFPIGSRLPLRVYNAVDAKEVLWTFNGGWIAVDTSGYYHVRKDGVLKAVVFWEDGGKDVIIKEIKVSE